MISSMARCPMMRRSSSAMGRMWEAGARISPLSDASCCGEANTCWCFCSGATTICSGCPHEHISTWVALLAV